MTLVIEPNRVNLIFEDSIIPISVLGEELRVLSSDANFWSNVVKGKSYNLHIQITEESKTDSLCMYLEDNFVFVVPRNMLNATNPSYPGIKMDTLHCPIDHIPKGWYIKQVGVKFQYIVMIPFWAKESVSLRDLILRIQDEAFVGGQLEQADLRLQVIVLVNAKDDINISEVMHGQYSELHEVLGQIRAPVQIQQCNWISSEITPGIPRTDYHNFLMSNRFTLDIIDRLRESRPNANLYIWKMDADTLSLNLNGQQGALSIYDEALSRFSEQNLPVILTGGYLTKGTTDRDGNQRFDLDVGVEIDLWFRFFLAYMFPTVPYVTEANALIKYDSIPNDFILFTPKDGRDGSANEMGHAKANLLKALSVPVHDCWDESKRPVRFVRDAVVQTRYREQAMEESISRNLVFGELDSSGKLVLFTPQELQHLRIVWQSHYNLLTSMVELSEQVCEFIGIKYLKRFEKEGVELIRKLFRLYDPLEYLKLRKKLPPGLVLCDFLKKFNKFGLHEGSLQEEDRAKNDLKCFLLEQYLFQKLGLSRGQIKEIKCEKKYQASGILNEYVSLIQLVDLVPFDQLDACLESPREFPRDFSSQISEAGRVSDRDLRGLENKIVGVVHRINSAAQLCGNEVFAVLKRRLSSSYEDNIPRLIKHYLKAVDRRVSQAYLTEVDGLNISCLTSDDDPDFNSGNYFGFTPLHLVCFLATTDKLSVFIG